jgi:hypothetical protein
MARRTTLRLAFALAALAGTQGFAQEAAPESQGPKEIIHHRTNPESHWGAPTAGSTSALKQKLSYHGGPVISTPTVYLIWYGNWAQTNGTDDANGQKIVTDFFQALGGSPYYMINSTYAGSANAISGNVTYGGQTTVSGYPQGTVLGDAAILTIVQNAINGGFGPAGGDANGLYFVLTSSDVNESSGFCTQYCGWHTHGSVGGRDIKYAFVGNAARCISACAAQSISPNGNPGVDGMVSVLAHECEEANTDSDLSAWYNNRGSENGDLCAWTFGSTYQVSNGSYANMKLGTRDFLIQRNVTIKPGGQQYCSLTK